jgi:hypothetical protein
MLFNAMTCVWDVRISESSKKYAYNRNTALKTGKLIYNYKGLIGCMIYPMKKIQE